MPSHSAAPSRSYSLLAPLIITAFVGVLAGCDAQPTKTSVEPPATSVPRGIAKLNSKAPVEAELALDKLLTGFETFAVGAGVQHHIIHAPNHDTTNHGIESAQPAIVLLAIDLNLFEPVLISLSDKRPKGISALEALANPQMTAVIGSSFVSQERNMSPVGLLLVSGQQKSQLEVHGYTRILGLRDTHDSVTALGVVHRSKYVPGQFVSALQAGPGIIEQGKLDILERELQRTKYFRSFVGSCGNLALIGTTLVPTNLYTLGKDLLRLAQQQNFACAEVVNLAGNREAVLALRNGTKVAYHGNPTHKKAALLGFKARN